MSRLLTDDATRVMLRFDEPDSQVLPSDEAGSLLDLGPDTGASLPALTAALHGQGRQFGAGVGLVAEEDVAGTTRLLRSLTMEAVINLEGGAQADGTYTILARGLSGSAAERRLYGLQIVRGAGPVYTLQAFAQETGGGAATIGGATFTLPLESNGSAYLSRFFYVACTREWVSDSLATYRYYVNGVQVGSTVTSTDADFTEGDGGSFTIGCRGDGVGGYENHFLDVIDCVRVSVGVRSAEEIRHEFVRLFVDPAHGYALQKSMLPPGPYSEDAGSHIQREIMVEGDGQALTIGLIRELRDLFLPDSTFRFLSRWEKVCSIVPRPADSIETRRARVIGHLRKIHGFTREEIVKAVADLLDQDEADVQIVEVSNRQTDDFEDASVGDEWLQNASAGTITEASGDLVLAAQNTDDVRWTASVNAAVYVRTTPQNPEGMHVMAKLDAWTLTDQNDLIGLLWYDALTGDWHVFGISRINNPGDETFTQRKRISGTVTEVQYTTPPAGPIYLRMLREDGGTLAIGYSTTGWEGPWTTIATGLATVADPAWVGLALIGGSSSSSGTKSGAFDEFRIWNPNSRSPFHWFIYRDPGDPGTPDIAGAQAVVDRMKPAHTEGDVTQSLSALCDDEYSLCDRTPLGA